MNFHTAAKILKLLGLEYNVEDEWRRRPEGRGADKHELELFSHVDPGLTPIDWVRIASRTGDCYIGGCCGSSSAMQDVVCGWFRMHPTDVPVKELADLAAGMIRHDGGEESRFSLEPFKWGVAEFGDDWTSLATYLSTGNPESTLRPWDQLDPWDKLALLWHIVKDSWGPEIPFAYAKDRDHLDQCLKVLSRAAQGISHHEFFASTRSADNEAGAPPRYSNSDRLLRAKMLASFIPAFKQFIPLIETGGSLDIGTLEGWAVVDLREGQDDDQICTNGFGFCVYAERSELDRVVGLWLNEDAQHQERKDKDRVYNRIGVRPIRVDWRLPNGFEFTGPVEKISG